MTRLVSVASTSPISVKNGEGAGFAQPLKSESRGKKSKGKGKSNRQIFMSELMKRISGDAGLSVVDSYVNDRSKFKSLMISIIGDMAKVDGDEEE